MANQTEEQQEFDRMIEKARRQGLSPNGTINSAVNTAFSMAPASPYNFDPDYLGANPFEQFGSKHNMLSPFVVDGKGVDISRASLALHALGEAAFLMDTKGEGKLTRAEVLDTALKLRDNFPILKDGLNGELINNVISFIPEKGITKGELVQKIHAVDSAMIAADKDHNGYLDGSELKVHITPKLEAAYSKAIKKLQTDGISGSISSGQSNPFLAQEDSLMKESAAKMPKSLRGFDKNHDGDISLTELRQVFKEKLGPAGEEALKMGGLLDGIPDGPSPLKGKPAPTASSGIAKAL